MGETRNTITCTECGNVNYKYEDFMTLSIPIPVINVVFYEVTFIGRSKGDTIPPPIKYGIKLPKYASIEEFNKAFEKVSGIPESKFVFAELYRHNLNFHSCFKEPKELVKNLGIRSNDEVVFYEILKNA